MNMNMSALAQQHAQPTETVPDRRGEQRVRTVYLIVMVNRFDDTGLFRARNISDTGMMLVTHVPFHAKERVSIELSDTLTVHGTVEWCSDGHCGVKFDRPIDSADFLKSLAEAKRECRRTAHRLPVKRLATSYSECGIRAVTITDVSSRGVGLNHNGSLRAGMMLKLVLESGLTRGGAVCWSRGGQAGVRLAEPFTREELESANIL
jgi:hypothetical protein